MLNYQRVIKEHPFTIKQLEAKNLERTDVRTAPSLPSWGAQIRWAVPAYHPGRSALPESHLPTARRFPASNIEALTSFWDMFGKVAKCWKMFFLYFWGFLAFHLRMFKGQFTRFTGWNDLLIPCSWQSLPGGIYPAKHHLFSPRPCHASRRCDLSASRRRQRAFPPHARNGWLNWLIIGKTIKENM